MARPPLHQRVQTSKNPTYASSYKSQCFRGCSYVKKKVATNCNTLDRFFLRFRVVDGLKSWSVLRNETTSYHCSKNTFFFLNVNHNPKAKEPPSYISWKTPLPVSERQLGFLQSTLKRSSRSVLLQHMIVLPLPVVRPW